MDCVVFNISAHYDAGQVTKIWVKNNLHKSFTTQLSIIVLQLTYMIGDTIGMISVE